MNDKFEDQRKQIADKSLQSILGLWSALLTINGILLAAFSSLCAISLSCGFTNAYAWQAWRDCVPNSIGPGGCDSIGPRGGRSIGPGGWVVYTEALVVKCLSN